MTGIPDAALAVMEAALDDYRVEAGDHATPHDEVRRVGEYLLSFGWAITPQPDPQDQP